MNDFDRFGLGQIERDTALALIVLIEVTRPIDTRLLVGKRSHQTRGANALGGFHPYYVGSEMSQLHCAIRPGPHPREVEHPYSRQWRLGSFARRRAHQIVSR